MPTSWFPVRKKAYCYEKPQIIEGSCKLFFRIFLYLGIFFHENCMQIFPIIMWAEGIILFSVWLLRLFLMRAYRYGLKWMNWTSNDYALHLSGFSISSLGFKYNTCSWCYSNWRPLCQLLCFPRNADLFLVSFLHLVANIASRIVTLYIHSH